MKKIYIILAYILSIYSTNAQFLPPLYDDGSFESSITTILNTYTFRKGLNYNSTNCGNLNATWGQPYTYNYTTHDNLNTSVSLVSTGFDEVLLQYGINHPRVKSGRNAIRLNEKIYNSGPNQKKEIVGIRKKYNNIKKYISFDFSLVGEVHSLYYHPTSEAFFSVRLITENGQVIPLTCYITNPSNEIYNFINISSHAQIFYTPWKKYNMAVPYEYIGENLTLEIITAGCAGGAHYQISYIDNISNTAESMSTPCDLQIETIEFNNNTQSYEICGNFTEPSSGSIYNLQVSASNGNETIQLPNIQPQINNTSNTFCIEIPSYDLQFSSATNEIVFNVKSFHIDYFSEMIYVCKDSDSIETNRCNVQITSNTFDSNSNSFIISGTYNSPNPGNLINISIFKEINENLVTIPVTNTNTNPNLFTFIVPISELSPSNSDIQLVVRGIFNDIALQKSTFCSETTIINKEFLNNCVSTLYLKDNHCDNFQPVNGTFDVPQEVSVELIKISVKDLQGNIIYTNSYTPYPPYGSYSFTIDTSNQVNQNSYIYEIEIDYLHSDGITKQKCISEHIKVFNQEFIDPIDFHYNISNGVLNWSNFTEFSSYQHQIVYDKSCNSSNFNPSQSSNIHSFYTSTNSISLAQLQQIAIDNNISSTSIRWRMSLGCGEWSEWCCIQLPNSPYTVNGNCISDFTEARSIPPYPNPTEGIITFQNNNYKFFEVINTKGNTIKKGNLDNTKEEITIDLSELNQDIYIIKFDNLDSYKVIKN